MSETLKWLKDIYLKAHNGDFLWKPIYPNNMPCNRKDGIYTDMFFEKDGKYEYLKCSIQYLSEVDEEGFSHPEKGTKYYVLHELRIEDLEETFEIPEPTDDFDFRNNLACLVNNYGRFRCVFDDEETAKKVISSELKNLIYPYTYLLNDEELEEWIGFVKQYE